MKCFFHNWSKWGLLYDSEITKSRGNFGSVSRDPVVVQDRRCFKCNSVQTRIVREGITSHNTESKQPYQRKQAQE